MRKLFALAACLMCSSIAALADDAKPAPPCGKTVVECQKLVDNQARIIVILQIKLGDYLNELAQAHDALETNVATQKAAQQAQAKH